MTAKIYRGKTKAIVVIPKWPPHNICTLKRLLHKGDKKHGYSAISKKIGTTPGSTETSHTTSKASPTSMPDLVTRQDIINGSLCKLICQKYLSYQTC